MLITASPMVLSGVIFLLIVQTRFRTRISPYFIHVVAFSWLVTRIGFYSAIYILPDSVGKDLLAPDILCKGGWIDQAMGVIAGELPYKGFFSNYSVLYSYLVATPYYLWRSPLAFAPLFMLFDLGCLFLVHAVARQRYGLPQAWDATLAFTLLPITWFVTVRLCQDEIVLAFFALLGTLAWQKRRTALAMIIFGIGFCCTKFMFVLIVLPFLLACRHKTKHTAVFASTLLAINLPFYLSGANVLAPLTNQSGEVNGCGLWPAVAEEFGIAEGGRMLYSAAMLSMVAVLCICTVISMRKKVFPADMACALMLVSVTLSPKTFLQYSLAFIPLFMVYAVANRETLSLAAYSVVPIVFDKLLIYYSADTRSTYVYVLVINALFLAILQSYWTVRILRTVQPRTGDRYGAHRGVTIPAFPRPFVPVEKRCAPSDGGGTDRRGLG